MTKKKAKELTLRIWRELAADGTIWYKEHISFDLYKEIEGLNNECPLCELFQNSHDYHLEWSENCSGCPLKEADNQCFSGKDFYSTWEDENDSAEERATQAQGIVDIVEKWIID